MSQSKTFKKTFQKTSSIENAFSVISAVICLLFLVPFFLFNIFSSVVLCQRPLKKTCINTNTEEMLYYYCFTFGVFKNALMLMLIIDKTMSWVGAPRDMDNATAALNHNSARLGLVSLDSLHRLTGLVALDNADLAVKQASLNMAGKFMLLVKFAFASLLYGNQAHKADEECQLFNLRINNVSLDKAVSLITSEQTNHLTKTACFVNVNSFNLSYNDPSLADAINDADYVFADGSGVRVAAQRKGYRLIDNVNGTDMLPLLCDQAVQKNKRIFLLGAKPGVAQQAANKLIEAHEGLQVSGVEHGFFDHQNCLEIIEKINNSHTDILLVAFGSPMQEAFLKNYRFQLQVNTAVAVGGLFDFYSGQIPRAPLWMRELGLEWVWRLIQEPKAKFHRYVIGNPLFLYRCFFNL